jgi:hypothetical protein
MDMVLRYCDRTRTLKATHSRHAGRHVDLVMVKARLTGRSIFMCLHSTERPDYPGAEDCPYIFASDLLRVSRRTNLGVDVSSGMHHIYKRRRRHGTDDSDRSNINSLASLLNGDSNDYDPTETGGRIRRCLGQKSGHPTRLCQFRCEADIGERRPFVSADRLQGPLSVPPHRAAPDPQIDISSHHVNNLSR